MIIIIGGSWAVGEYNKQNELNGPGFGHYMMLHDQVINLGVGGSTDFQCLQRLEVFLQKFHFDSAQDIIYWVVNSPPFVNQNLLESNKTLTENALESMKELFQHANQICKLHHASINLIGGLCDLGEISYLVTDRLSVKVDSWGKLIDENYYTSWLTPNSSTWSNLGNLLKSNRQDYLEEWIQISDKILKKELSWKKLQNKGFGTDGIHPDRYGHRILRDYLYPEWARKI